MKLSKLPGYCTDLKSAMVIALLRTASQVNFVADGNFTVVDNETNLFVVVNYDQENGINRLPEMFVVAMNSSSSI